MKKQRIFLVLEKLPEPPDYPEAYECPCCEDMRAWKRFKAEETSWLEHYKKFHGMTFERFYRIEDGIDS